MTEIILDVREPDEFEVERIPGAINIPLSNFKEELPHQLESLRAKEVVIICQGGRRAELARKEIQDLDSSVQCSVFAGGLNEWKRQGKAMQTIRAPRLPIMRQVQITAGMIVFCSSLLAYFVNPNFVFVAGFVGAGLTFAGISGYCGMATLLSKMPWNR